MGRHKTISDDQLLDIARKLFREKGHTTTTREIAEAADISEAVLYQRFASKDELFFAAMHARGPDVDELLGPIEPVGDAFAYLRSAVVRMGKYFAEVIPLAVRVMTHPSFNPAALKRMQPGGSAVLEQGLAERLGLLARRKSIAATAEAATARLLVSIAHDWALRHALSHGAIPLRERDLTDMVDVVWKALQPR